MEMWVISSVLQIEMQEKALCSYLLGAMGSWLMPYSSGLASVTAKGPFSFRDLRLTKRK